MDEVTQQNAALVEEAAAAAESMNDQAQALTQAVSVFKVSGGAGHVQGAPIKRSNRTASIAKLPNRGPAKKAVVKSHEDSVSTQPRKVASGGGDDWEEF
jgi:methyl-accepting chemotaxis protein